ncbi:MAG TPA: hypothetical protein DCQ04_07420 [Actinobacteria bacterium]|nr:hypothetical protein [Actinomycetota bacterium]
MEVIGRPEVECAVVDRMVDRSVSNALAADFRRAIGRTGRRGDRWVALANHLVRQVAELAFTGEERGP